MLAPAILAALLPVSAFAAESDFATVDAAAIAFVERARAEGDQKKERCAWLIKRKDTGRVYVGVINEGDMDRCPSAWPKPAGTVGSAHTHPIWGPGAENPGAAGQVFSEGDFAHAESDQVRVPIYLGAPLGHILRYDPGGTLCYGRSFIARVFKIVRDVRPSVAGELPLRSGEKTPLYDQLGKAIPKPAYCADQAR